LTDEVKNMRDPKITRQVKDLFLQRIAGCGSIPQSCAGLVSRRTVFLWRRYDLDFKARFDEAILGFIEKLEAEADRRAVEGVPRDVLFHGKRIATERQYSDSLLMFRLRSLAPEKYRFAPYPAARQRKTGAATAPPGGQKDQVIRVVYGDDESDRQPGGQTPSPDR
jgi:hypothetical protein